jgi:hypothetical protein
MNICAARTAARALQCAPERRKGRLEKWRGPFFESQINAVDRVYYIAQVIFLLSQLEYTLQMRMTAGQL